MTVHPGFGGQAFISEMTEKISAAAELRKKEGLHFHIEVDGGIDAKTAAPCHSAGANVFVAGTSIFKAQDISTTIRNIRGEH